MRWIFGLGAVAAAMALAAPAAAKDYLGSACNNPPRVNCPNANCAPAMMQQRGMATDPKTGRAFFLDYPCDLKPGEKVTFILNLHGAGSIGNWQRHYFPIVDLKEKYRLVVATPTAATDQPTRRWTAEADDAHLQNISEMVMDAFGRNNIRAFWLAGHSQGGITSRRIVCSDYFRSRVDGFLSLSGGRINPPGAPAGTIAPRPPAAGAAAPPAAPPQPAPLPACDFSFIFAVGELEVANGIATASPWAEKYGCSARVRRPDVADTRAGYVTATDQSRGPSWGRFARPGTAQVMVYPDCRGGRVVADVVRIDKGHTEGLEPNVMDTIVKLMVSAPGGKAQRKS